VSQWLNLEQNNNIILIKQAISIWKLKIGVIVRIIDKTTLVYLV